MHRRGAQALRCDGPTATTWVKVEEHWATVTLPHNQCEEIRDIVWSRVSKIREKLLQAH